MGKNSVQSVGDFTAVLQHPNVLGGAAIPLTGFKLEGTMIDGSQLLDNSKIIALVNGDTVTLTNTVKAGTITWTCIPSTFDEAGGDIVAISQLLQTVGDNVGGTLRVSFGLNGATFAITFTGVTMKRVPPLKLAGNDIPDYAVEWNYGDYEKS